MQYLNVKRIADKWKVTERRVVSLLRAGRIPGAVKNGMSWQIPVDAIKPYDRRARYAVHEQSARRVVIAGINNEIGSAAARLFTENGYDIIGLYHAAATIDPGRYTNNIQLVAVDYLNPESLAAFADGVSGYLDGFVFAELFLNSGNDFDAAFRGNVIPMNILSTELAKKMNADAGIVILNSIDWTRDDPDAAAYAAAQAAKEKLVETFAETFARLYGVRINTVTASWPGNQMDGTTARQYIGMPNEIADDIFVMMTRHKFTTGANIRSDGGYLYFDADGRGDAVDTKKLYTWLHKIWGDLTPGDNVWVVETMLDNEWADIAPERQYLTDILNAVQRGVKLKRIFLFGRKDIKKYKHNKFLITFATNKKIDAMWADRDLIAKRAPELLDAVGLGIVGFNDDLLGGNTPPAPDGSLRGMYSRNKRDIAAAKKAFNGIKKFAVPLKTVIK
ncbi:MAG: SDR family oxidoreductase [Proteobacteria bacterium]|nr:SDR family oxidoreductase [Pseudomonadota bacterium]